MTSLQKARAKAKVPPVENEKEKVKNGMRGYEIDEKKRTIADKILRPKVEQTKGLSLDR